MHQRQLPARWRQAVPNSLIDAKRMICWAGAHNGEYGADSTCSAHCAMEPSDDEQTEGGGFLYKNCPELFLGRAGYGPLRVAWDTNVLIDYAEFGDLMWEDDNFGPPISEPYYREELVALDTLIHLWMMRNIRVRSTFASCCIQMRSTPSAR